MTNNPFIKLADKPNDDIIAWVDPEFFRLLGAKRFIELCDQKGWDWEDWVTVQVSKGLN